MPKTYKRNVKKGKFRMLLFFLLVTFFIWFLTKLSKEFTATVEASIEYENIPSSTILASNNIEVLSFDLTSNGFDFLSYKLKKPVITINVSDYYNKEKQSIIINNISLVKLITSELNSKITVKNVSVNEITVLLDKIVTKTVPIIVDSKISFQNGFQAVEELSIHPSFIEVSGPSEFLDDLKEVKTKPLKLELLTTGTSGKLKLLNSKNLNITLSEEMVSYKIVVEEFTQKEISFQLEIINLPLGIKIKLIPEAITVVFDISVSKFNAISDKDFSIICDYKKRDIEENLLTAEIVKKPIIIQNLFLKNNKIKYLLLK